MTIFFMEWKSFGNEDIIENLEAMGCSVKRIPFCDDTLNTSEIREIYEKNLQKSACDFVFSFNYYPEISKACKELDLKYVSWVYDNPHIQVYSYTVINECNYVFLFDYAMYQELYNAGIRTVYYLPLAINTRRMERLDRKLKDKSNYDHVVTFIGSLYSEKKHRLYDKFKALSEFYKGYLDGLINAQKSIQGYYFLRDLLNPETVAEMQKIYPTNPNAESVLSPEALYADYVLARQVTALERRESLEKLGEVAPVSLFTHEKEIAFPGVHNYGPCDYYNHMPQIMRKSKINLNITLKSIQTGIPLRALDILGNGGFLLTNYQEELMQYFEPDRDFVYYTDADDLVHKVQYYLEHDDEREAIAQRGREKSRALFSYENQLRQILDIVEGECS